MKETVEIVADVTSSEPQCIVGYSIWHILFFPTLALLLLSPRSWFLLKLMDFSS